MHSLPFLNLRSRTQLIPTLRATLLYTHVLNNYLLHVQRYPTLRTTLLYAGVINNYLLHVQRYSTLTNPTTTYSTCHATLRSRAQQLLRLRATTSSTCNATRRLQRHADHLLQPTSSIFFVPLPTAYPALRASIPHPRGNSFSYPSFHCFQYLHVSPHHPHTTSPVS
ncbi:hypothetical protein Pcinc_002339 [Petrolisthes cinctipes]|uniref:Uncharacterized protein n=1 Tax=Petrolisthes cinctipes TaxID=88211 RepID=A0AAE1GJX8_PETCI|nr:hypothetical protein Pcinc_017895 [Petrolisthes cinctipes]KAK3885191.1 hypothetical protein Pcinc_010583 [Petrolisthes cinctipes]KAK3886774.1 hypothetical protein Pcinc_009094 [Petrolisthes cinctipes]KAK3893847.1 hypothetical protein Pcinc_002339 [Petrolisthes cinctipes]